MRGHGSRQTQSLPKPVENDRDGWFQGQRVERKGRRKKREIGGEESESFRDSWGERKGEEKEKRDWWVSFKEDPIPTL